MFLNNQVKLESIIFLVGFPRSGTTYLQSLIATQKNIVSLPETHFFSYNLDGLNVYEKKKVDVLAFKIIQTRLKKMMDFTFSEETRLKLQNLAEIDSLGIKELFEYLITDYAYQNNIVLQGKTLLEKTPDHARKLNEIRHFYPDAKFVVITRSPIGAINSFHNKLIEWRQPYPKLAKYWVELMTCVKKFILKYPNQIYLVEYEKLVRDKEKCLTELFFFLKLSIDESLLVNYREKAKKLVLEKEIWKNSNTTGFVYSVDKKMNFFQKLIVKNIVRNVAKEFGYVYDKNLIDILILMFLKVSVIISFVINSTLKLQRLIVKLNPKIS